MSNSQTEETITKVWRQLLKVEDVRPEQSFFELGGDSLLMLDMLFQLNQELGVEVDPTLLFEDATLQGFSRLVETARQSEKPEEGVI